MAAMAHQKATLDHDAWARRLREAYDGPIAPIRLDMPAASVDDAYAIQAANTAFWLNAGRRRRGAKIGLTAKAVQAQLGVDQPDFGVLFEDMEIETGGAVVAGRLIQPKVEAEVAFTLARTPDTTDLDTLAASVAYAQAALEIVDSRIIDWNIGILDTVADNASSALFVLGQDRVALSQLDLRLCGMTLEKNGAIASLGVGAACLGNPLIALAWLADMMASLGEPLREDDVVLSGALGPMVAALPGDAFAAAIAGLGEVSVRFEDIAQ
ncbi:2-keto-4-pentenoate hydratase [soil metagenome]